LVQNISTGKKFQKFSKTFSRQKDIFFVSVYKLTTNWSKDE